MIIKYFIPEIILLGSFFTIALIGMAKKTKCTKKKSVQKPYFLMNKKELAELELKVDNNLDKRAILLSRFELLNSDNFIKPKTMDYVKNLVLSDINGYKGTKNAYALISNCLKDEYISNKNLNIISDILDLESKSFFNSKSSATRKQTEKAKVIELKFSK